MLATESPVRPAAVQFDLEPMTSLADNSPLHAPLPLMEMPSLSADVLSSSWSSSASSSSASESAANDVDDPHEVVEEAVDEEENDGQTHKIPCVSGASRRINGHTMAQLLTGHFTGSRPDQIDECIVIDCRYDYEYTGGHIAGAINIHDRASLAKFFRRHARSGRGSRLALVFHCEFSQNRGPKSYRFLRELDRMRNGAAYPALCIPEMVVLDGGYKRFHAEYPQHCTRAPLAALTENNGNAAAAAASTTPSASPNKVVGPRPGPYVAMAAPQYLAECKSRTAAHRRSWHTVKAQPEDLDSEASGKSPARGLKRSAPTHSPDSIQTPSRPNSCTPSPSMRGGLFAPSPAVRGGLFASPVGTRPNSASSSRSRRRGLAAAVSPLPSFDSFGLISTRASPATPEHYVRSGAERAYASADATEVQPVPFHMQLSPDKA